MYSNHSYKNWCKRACSHFQAGSVDCNPPAAVAMHVGWSRAHQKEPVPSGQECLWQGRYTRPAWVLADRVAWFPSKRSAATSLAVACWTVRDALQIWIFLLSMFLGAEVLVLTVFLNCAPGCTFGIKVCTLAHFKLKNQMYFLSGKIAFCVFLCILVYFGVLWCTYFSEHFFCTFCPSMFLLHSYQSTKKKHM